MIGHTAYWEECHEERAGDGENVVADQRNRIHQKPIWGTCAGLILLSDEANATKKGGQELIGGLGVRVHRNHFGRQVDSFMADLDLPFLGDGAGSYRGVFIRAPVVEEVLRPHEVEVLATVERRKGDEKSREIVAVRQQNILGMSFHPELTDDERIHAWWLGEVLKELGNTR
jgi:pyridoxal 5'-phosphate synthase pdxT subunit